MQTQYRLHLKSGPMIYDKGLSEFVQGLLLNYKESDMPVCKEGMHQMEISPKFGDDCYDCCGKLFQLSPQFCDVIKHKSKQITFIS